MSSEQRNKRPHVDPEVRERRRGASTRPGTTVGHDAPANEDVAANDEAAEPTGAETTDLRDTVAERRRSPIPHRKEAGKVRDIKSALENLE